MRQNAQNQALKYVSYSNYTIKYYKMNIKLFLWLNAFDCADGVAASAKQVRAGFAALNECREKEGEREGGMEGERERGGRRERVPIVF